MRPGAFEMSLRLALVGIMLQHYFYHSLVAEADMTTQESGTRCEVLCRGIGHTPHLARYVTL